MTTAQKEMSVAAGQGQGQNSSLVKRLLNSMWGFWLSLLAISFGVAAVIYWVWLRGSV
jgi:hypothetical protein